MEWKSCSCQMKQRSLVRTKDVRVGHFPVGRGEEENPWGRGENSRGKTRNSSDPILQKCINCYWLRWFDKEKHYILSLLKDISIKKINLHTKSSLICGLNENVYQRNLQSALPRSAGFVNFGRAGNACFSRGEHPWWELVSNSIYTSMHIICMQPASLRTERLLLEIWAHFHQVCAVF